MKVKFISVLMVVIFTFNIVLTKAYQECQLNANWVDCGSGCPATCNQSPPPPGGCLSCVPACQCNPGFVLNDANQCVSPVECPPAPPVVVPV